MPPLFLVSGQSDPRSELQRDSYYCKTLAFPFAQRISQLADLLVRYGYRHKIHRLFPFVLPITMTVDPFALLAPPS